MEPFRILDRQWNIIADFPTLLAARIASIDLPGVAIVEIDGEEETIIHYERGLGLDWSRLEKDRVGKEGDELTLPENHPGNIEAYF